MSYEEIGNYFNQGWAYLGPALEVFIIFYIIYVTLHYLRGTRGSNVLAGIVVVLLLLTILSDWAKFEVINYLLNGVWSLLAVALIVIFQPELRRAFAQVGSYAFLKRSRKKETITELVAAVLNMSRRRTGAIIVIERKIGMRSIVEDAVKLDIKLNALIIESIFYPNSPLHDGAVIIRNDRIVAARAILPLSRDDNISRTMGTRHRAAIGITEETDAVVVVVSEETGNISIACRGVIHRDITADNLQKRLNDLLILQNKESFADLLNSMEDEEKLEAPAAGTENSDDVQQ
ncbi:diadenylate cyclase CdaA [Victivallis sp. Marseille-Q1083]|uniref:diadenylate cyclase CdaA n=1 Tax=Victivallis sp. Marseille-Q1083 TaxID=2717288 RepID=UPI00158CB881|nr:diadenylate cyclase CdaA [Victivallis sp. Marseille-Q1083]